VHVSGLGIHGGDDAVFGDPAGDAPPPVGAVRALGGLDVLPSDQRQQREGTLGRFVQLRVTQRLDDPVGVVDQR
jgi:hypothetical protein